MLYTEQHFRIRLVFLVLIGLFLAILGKILYIQVFSYEKISSLAENLWTRELPITADRGDILDRNGKVLATSVTSVSLYLVPSQIEDKEEVARTLSDILGVTYEEMYDHVSKKTSLERVHPEGRGLDEEVASKIESYHYDGVYLLKESKRNYPYGDVLSQVLGYVGIDNQGLSGIESTYEEVLTGKNGYIKYYSDAKGNKLVLPEDYVEPTKGEDVTLTIDLDLQLAMERELNNAMDEYSPIQALAVAMNPKTGEILAMASKPGFDSNNYQTATQEILNRNLPIWMTYEPGSTMKITTLAAAIEEGVVDLFKDTYYDDGSVEVSGATIHCWKSGGHGYQTYLQVVENSCNPGFVKLGLTLGKEKLFSYIEKLGFGKKTGIDLNGESTGILFDLEDVGDLELATTSFGQGISVTPIQQVRSVSALINGGTLYTPYIVKKVGDTEKSTTYTTGIVSENTSSLVRFALENVVAHGSGRNAYIENYRVGGKTGTAQKVENGSYLVGNYIVSFIGFMPADDPEIVIYVAVDYPKGVSQYGGVVAAPIAKAILESYISIKGLEPTTEGIPKTYNWNDTKYSVISDCTGKSLDTCEDLLKGYHLELSGSGNTITYQSPKGGSYVEEGGTITLYLED